MAKSKPSWPAAVSSWEVMRCAPAPMSDATADNRITVGNSRASMRTSAGRSASTRASTRNTGRVSAARPEVAGTANAVATRAIVTRWTRVRGPRAPVSTKAAARVASPDSDTA